MDKMVEIEAPDAANNAANNSMNNINNMDNIPNVNEDISTDGMSTNTSLEDSTYMTSPKLTETEIADINAIESNIQEGVLGNLTPHLSSQLLTPIVEDGEGVDGVDDVLLMDNDSDNDDQNLITDDDNDQSGSVTPKGMKTYPRRSRRSTISSKTPKKELKRLIKKTSRKKSVAATNGTMPVKTPAKAPAKKKPSKEKLELDEIRAANVSLGNAFKLLQESLIKQGAQIAELSSKIADMETKCLKDADSKVSGLETRMVSYYSDQETKCVLNMKQAVATSNKRIDACSKRIDKISSKVDNQTVKPDSLLPGSVLQDLDTRIKDLTMENDKFDHELASVKDSLSKLVDDQTPFTFGAPADTSFGAPAAAPDDPSFGAPATAPATAPAGTSWADASMDSLSANDKTPEKLMGNHGIGDDIAADSLDPEKENLGSKGSNSDISTKDRKDDSAQMPKTRKWYNSLLLIDSNVKHLQKDLLWSHNTIIQCSTTYDLHSKLISTNLADIDLIFIHVGVNDIDTDNGDQVSTNLINIVTKLKNEFPHMKIVVSEVTPRTISRDEEVLKRNDALHAALKTMKDVTIARHSNLRNDRWSFHVDDKHFAQISIARFAKNLKIAFFRAIGQKRLPEQKSAKDTNNLKNLNKKNKYNDTQSKQGGGSDNSKPPRDFQTLKKLLVEFLEKC